MVKFLVALQFVHYAGVAEKFALIALMKYLTDVWGLGLIHAAGLINLWIGATKLMPFFFLFLMDNYVRNSYLMVIFSTAASGLGMGLLSVSSPSWLYSKITGTCREYTIKCIDDRQQLLFYLAIVFISIGKSVREATMETLSFKGKPYAREMKKCLVGYSDPLKVTFMVGLLFSLTESWSIRFGISAVFSFITLHLLMGKSLTHQIDIKVPEMSPVTTMLKVFVASFFMAFEDHPYKLIDKDEPRLSHSSIGIEQDDPRLGHSSVTVKEDDPCLSHSSTGIQKDDPQLGQSSITVNEDDPQLSHSSTGIEKDDPQLGHSSITVNNDDLRSSHSSTDIANDDPQLRRRSISIEDDIPILSHSSTRLLENAENLSASDSHNSGIRCAPQDIEDTKTFKRLLPVTFAFIFLGLVSSMGNTFFITQVDRLDPSISFWTHLGVSQLFSFYEGSKNSHRKYSSKTFEFSFTYPHRVLISSAIFNAILCCLAAALVETARLYVIAKHDLGNNPESIIPMRTFWLIPQFIFLGVVDGMMERSLDIFFMREMPWSMRNFGVLVSRGFVGLGMISSVLFVYVIDKVSKIGGRPSWFQSKMETSRVDLFYWLLMVLCVVLLVTWGVLFLYVGLSWLTQRPLNYNEDVVDRLIEPGTDLNSIEDGEVGDQFVETVIMEYLVTKALHDARNA